MADRRWPRSSAPGSPSTPSGKGLELDLVVVVDPETFGDGIEGAVDRYVAMTRATQRLVILAARSMNV
jgi:DNA helicase IV